MGEKVWYGNELVDKEELERLQEQERNAQSEIGKKMAQETVDASKDGNLTNNEAAKINSTDLLSTLSPKSYYPDDGSAPVSMDKIDSAMSLMDELYPKDKKSAAPATSGSGTVQSTGTYGTLRNEDFSAYRAQRDAERKRNWEAIRAGRQAEADKRNELLATGRFFDDGRGNIKMKKEYRRQGVNGERNTSRHFNKDTEHNTYADATNRMIKAAGQTAFQSSMDAAIEANRLGMEQVKSDRSRRAADIAAGEVAVFDSLVAALDDMRTGNHVQEEVIGGSRGIEMSDGQGNRWTYDSNGNRVPVSEGKKTGLSIRSGFLSPTSLKALNGELERVGSNRRVSGIIVRQKFDPKFPDKKIGDPMFYVQGYRFNPEIKKSSPYGQWMTMKDVYRMGLSNAKAAGGMFSDTHSEESIHDMLDDVYGTGTRAREAAAAKNAIPMAELKVQQEKAKLERDKFEYDQRKYIYEKVTQWEKENGRSASNVEFVSMLPESLQKTLSQPVPVLDENNVQKIADYDNPITRNPTADEIGARIKALRSEMEDEAYKRKNPYEQLIGILTGNNSFATPSQDVPATGTAVNASGARKEQELRVQKKMAQRATATVAESAPAVATAAPASARPQAPTPAPAQGQPIVEKQQELIEKMKGGNGKNDAARREVIAQKRRKEDITKAGVNESIATQYDLILPSIMAKLRAAIPEMSNSDLYSGKYDKQILALAKRLGDESTPEILSQIKMLKDEKSNKEKEADIQRIREEAERLGIRKGWSQEMIDAKAKEDIARRRFGSSLFARDIFPLM